MTKENNHNIQNQNQTQHPTVSKVVLLTSEFENQISDLIWEVKRLESLNQRKVIAELNSVIDNIKFVISALTEITDKER